MRTNVHSKLLSDQFRWSRGAKRVGSQTAAVFAAVAPDIDHGVQVHPTPAPNPGGLVCPVRLLPLPCSG